MPPPRPATPAKADPKGENYCFDKAVKIVPANGGSKDEGGFVGVRKPIAAVPRVATHPP